VNNKLERMWKKSHCKYRKYPEETEKNVACTKIIDAYSRLKKRHYIYHCNQRAMFKLISKLNFLKY